MYDLLGGKFMKIKSVNLLVKRIAETKNLSAKQKIALITDLAKPIKFNRGG